MVFVYSFVLMGLFLASPSSQSVTQAFQRGKGQADLGAVHEAVDGLVEEVLDPRAHARHKVHGAAERGEGARDGQDLGMVYYRWVRWVGWMHGRWMDKWMDGVLGDARTPPPEDRPTYLRECLALVVGEDDVGEGGGRLHRVLDLEGAQLHGGARDGRQVLEHLQDVAAWPRGGRMNGWRCVNSIHSCERWASDSKSKGGCCVRRPRRTHRSPRACPRLSGRRTRRPPAGAGQYARSTRGRWPRRGRWPPRPPRGGAVWTDE